MYPWHTLYQSYIDLELYICSYLKINIPQPCFSFDKYLPSACDKPVSSFPFRRELSRTHDLYWSKLQPHQLHLTRRRALFGLDRFLKTWANILRCANIFKKKKTRLFLLKNPNRLQCWAHTTIWQQWTRAEIGRWSPARAYTHARTQSHVLMRTH